MAAEAHQEMQMKPSCVLEPQKIQPMPSTEPPRHLPANTLAKNWRTHAKSCMTDMTNSKYVRIQRAKLYAKGELQPYALITQPARSFPNVIVRSVLVAKMNKHVSLLLPFIAGLRFPGPSRLPLMVNE